MQLWVNVHAIANLIILCFIWFLRAKVKIENKNWFKLELVDLSGGDNS